MMTGGSWSANTNYTTYTLTTSDTTTFPVGQLVIADPTPASPPTEVERLMNDVERVCALAR